MLQKNLRLAVGKPCYISYIILCRIMDYTKCNSVLNNVLATWKASVMHVYKLLNVNQKIYYFSEIKLLKHMIPSILQSIDFLTYFIQILLYLSPEEDFD